MPTPSPTLPPVEYVRRHGNKGAGAFSRSPDPNASPLGLPPPPMGHWGLSSASAMQLRANDDAARAVEIMASPLAKELDYMQSIEHGDGTVPAPPNESLLNYHSLHSR